MKQRFFFISRQLSSRSYVPNTLYSPLSNLKYKNECWKLSPSFFSNDLRWKPIETSLPCPKLRIKITLSDFIGIIRKLFLVSEKKLFCGIIWYWLHLFVWFQEKFSNWNFKWQSSVVCWKLDINTSNLTSYRYVVKF